MSDQLLNGIRVVDLSMGWAGPLAARHLADMGAQVIKVEGCVKFDWWRSWEATPEWIADNGAEKALPYLYNNRNKLDITLELDTAKGRDLLLQLVATADAVVENFAGGVLNKLELDYPHIKQANEQIVMLSMPAFGSDGPWANFRAYGSTVEQASGLPHLNGLETDPPTMLQVALGDPVAGLNGAAALLTALMHKQATGEGQYIDLSQPECLFPLGVHGILHQAVLGEAPRRYGNDHPDFAPHGVYPCRGEDRWVVIQAFTEPQWQSLKALCGLDYGDKKDRLARRKALNEELANWTRNQDMQELTNLLQAQRIPCGPVNSALDLMQDPHLLERNYLQWLEHEFVGKLVHPSPPYRNGHDPIPVRSTAPTLGQHNAQVLGGILGLDEQQLAELEKERIIGTKPRMPD